MKKIKLTQNQFAIIDDEDFELIFKHKYCADKIGNTFYAMRRVSRRTTICMHTEIIEKKIGRKLKTKEEIHHVNENGLDNRKCNLQIVTRSQHMMCSKKQKDCTSQYKGVGQKDYI